LAQATTTTTTAPPEPDPATPTTAAGRAGTTTTTRATTSTTEGPITTTTTAPGPLVQIVSYAGRTTGVATITVRYERIGTAEDVGTQAETLEFRVIVGTLQLPALPDTVPG
jgi:hypothetical protein